MCVCEWVGVCVQVGVSVHCATSSLSAPLSTLKLCEDMQAVSLRDRGKNLKLFENSARAAAAAHTFWPGLPGACS